MQNFNNQVINIKEKHVYLVTTRIILLIMPKKSIIINPTQNMITKYKMSFQYDGIRFKKSKIRQTS